MALSTEQPRAAGRFREINVTPLVDVMLVLLIVFMVTAPLLTSGLHIDLPEVQATNTPVKDAKLVVSITKDEHILFGEDDVTADIEKALLENPRVQKEHELYIRADKEARYGVVARAVAAARVGGRDVAQPAGRAGGDEAVTRADGRRPAHFDAQDVTIACARRAPRAARLRRGLLAALAQARPGRHLERQRAAHRRRHHAGAQARHQDAHEAPVPVAAQAPGGRQDRSRSRRCPRRRPRRRPRPSRRRTSPTPRSRPRRSTRADPSRANPTAPEGASTSPTAASAEGSEQGAANGTETDPLKARAADMYRAQLASWFAAPLPDPGQSPVREAQDTPRGRRRRR